MDTSTDKFFAIVVIVAAIILLIHFLTGKAFSSEPINDNNAIMAIIGEAENQGYEGMYAVACAIRNRGTLKGVYGYKAPRVVKKLYSKKIAEQAERAWYESQYGQDVTLGSDHWENVTAFGKPYWADSMEKTVKIGDHQFYRSRS